MNRVYIGRILGVFLASLLIYLGIAWWVLAPLGYYGTRERPRFADPWIARAETILHGGRLYEDVFTSTPPLMNYLLIPPVIVSGWFGHQNPWATLAFMIYYSLFNLFVAYTLFFTASDRAEGYHWALLYLANPLTFGNTVLRRQDESVSVFFFALALLFVLHNRHWRSSIVMGLSLLVKLTGGMLIPVAFLETRKWQYLIIPFAVFGMIFAPFLLTAGRSAVFWDINQEHTEHPFQFGGVSLGALWLKWRGSNVESILRVYSLVFVIGVVLVLGYIALRPKGMWVDFTLLVAAVLLLSPKLHCGYFSILVLAMTPLVRPYRLGSFYFTFAVCALIADMYKWPVEHFPAAFWGMVAVYVVLIGALLWLYRALRRARLESLS